MSVLNMLLVVDPAERSSAEDILLHPWCQSSEEDVLSTYESKEMRRPSYALEDDSEDYTFNRKISKETYSDTYDSLMSYVRSILDDSNLKTRVKGENITFSILTPGGVSILTMEVSENNSSIIVENVNIYCMNKLSTMFS